MLRTRIPPLSWVSIPLKKRKRIFLRSRKKRKIRWSRIWTRNRRPSTTSYKPTLCRVESPQQLTMSTRRFNTRHALSPNSSSRITPTLRSAAYGTYSGVIKGVKAALWVRDARIHSQPRLWCSYLSLLWLRVQSKEVKKLIWTGSNHRCTTMTGWNTCKATWLT